MKNLIRILLLACALVCMLMMCASAESPDAITSASVADFYADSALTGDDLMNAINAFSGTYLVSTTNPDGTPNTAYFIFSMVKHEDQYYLQLGLAENQSKANLEANGVGQAVYAALPGSEEGAKPYSVSGARIRFKALEDPSLAEVLNASGRPGAMFFEITEIRPLG
ncbi:MAG: hypothetical protein IJB85_10450 [Clostridia bacterium]|nr:hypothetical protein [Clostridia bacterium]